MADTLTRTTIDLNGPSGVPGLQAEVATVEARAPSAADAQADPFLGTEKYGVIFQAMTGLAAGAKKQRTVVDGQDAVWGILQGLAAANDDRGGNVIIEKITRLSVNGEVDVTSLFTSLPMPIAASVLFPQAAPGAPSVTPPAVGGVRVPPPRTGGGATGDGGSSRSAPPPPVIVSRPSGPNFNGAPLSVAKFSDTDLVVPAAEGGFSDLTAQAFDGAGSLLDDHDPAVDTIASSLSEDAASIAAAESDLAGASFVAGEFAHSELAPIADATAGFIGGTEHTVDTILGDTGSDPRMNVTRSASGAGALPEGIVRPPIVPRPASLPTLAAALAGSGAPPTQPTPAPTPAPIAQPAPPPSTVTAPAPPTAPPSTIIAPPPVEGPPAPRVPPPPSELSHLPPEQESAPPAPPAPSPVAPPVEAPVAPIVVQPSPPTLPTPPPTAPLPTEPLFPPVPPPVPAPPTAEPVPPPVEAPPAPPEPPQLPESFTGVRRNLEADV